jgi:hypothetical protein
VAPSHYEPGAQREQPTGNPPGSDPDREKPDRQVLGV